MGGLADEARGQGGTRGGYEIPRTGTGTGSGSREVLVAEEEGKQWNKAVDCLESRVARGGEGKGRERLKKGAGSQGAREWTDDGCLLLAVGCWMLDGGLDAVVDGWWWMVDGDGKRWTFGPRPGLQGFSKWVEACSL